MFSLKLFKSPNDCLEISHFLNKNAGIEMFKSLCNLLKKASLDSNAVTLKADGLFWFILT